MLALAAVVDSTRVRTAADANGAPDVTEVRAAACAAAAPDDLLTRCVPRYRS